MTLTAPPPVDTRSFFRPVARELVSLLRGLAPDDWTRPTIAGSWRVRDVAAHLLDITLRRLSFHRDAMAPPPPAKPIASERDFVDFINGINADWVSATHRLSPRVLTDLLEKGTSDLADWFESLPPDAPGLFGVSWAGEMQSEGWFDIGREFTELWHHQEQIRLAVGVPSLPDPRYLRAVLEISIRALPHSYREVAGSPGDTLVIEITGPSGGVWTLAHDGDRWALMAGEAPAPAARARLSDASAWRLFYNALRGEEAVRAITVEGAEHLGAPLLRTRSIVI